MQWTTHVACAPVRPHHITLRIFHTQVIAQYTWYQLTVFQSFRSQIWRKNLTLLTICIQCYRQGGRLVVAYFFVATLYTMRYGVQIIHTRRLCFRAPHLFDYFLQRISLLGQTLHQTAPTDSVSTAAIKIFITVIIYNKLSININVYSAS